MRYGGNTTCMEIRTDINQLTILEAGTSILPLSQILIAELPITANAQIADAHWNHIQSCFDSVSSQSIDLVSATQLQYRYFPARDAEMQARIEYVIPIPAKSVQIGSATVTPYMLNHPVIDFGYCKGKSVLFAGDHEPPYNIFEPGNDKTTIIHEVVQVVGVFIADCSYTDAEYECIGSDDALEAAFDEALLSNAGVIQRMDIPLAREGDCYEY